MDKAIFQKLLDYLTKNNIKYMVAPFEADSQLAYLYINKKIDVNLIK